MKKKEVLLLHQLTEHDGESKHREPLMENLKNIRQDLYTGTEMNMWGAWWRSYHGGEDVLVEGRRHPELTGLQVNRCEKYLSDELPWGRFSYLQTIISKFISELTLKFYFTFVCPWNSFQKKKTSDSQSSVRTITTTIPFCSVSFSVAFSNSFKCTWQHFQHNLHAGNTSSWRTKTYTCRKTSLLTWELQCTCPFSTYCIFAVYMEMETGMCSNFYTGTRSCNFPFSGKAAVVSM